MGKLDKEIAAAKSGDMGPLLDACKTIEPGQKVSENYSDSSGGVANDPRWMEVLGAYGEDELTDEQMKQCSDAWSSK